MSVSCLPSVTFTVHRETQIPHHKHLPCESQPLSYQMALLTHRGSLLFPQTVRATDGNKLTNLES